MASRWIATVPLQREWTHHALVAADFAYWARQPHRPAARRDPTTGSSSPPPPGSPSVWPSTHTGMEGGAATSSGIDQLGITQSPLADVVVTNRVEFPPTETIVALVQVLSNHGCPARFVPTGCRPSSKRPICRPPPDLVVSPPASHVQASTRTAPGVVNHHRGRQATVALPRPRPEP